MAHDVHIIGGGLAGSEAAWQLAQRGVKVRLSEMRGSGEMTPAHQTDGLAELVCSNSFRSDDDTKNAVGLLHHEMRELDSIVMRAGEVARVPAGSAMAVDRDVFSAEVEKALSDHPNVEIVRERVDSLPESGLTIVATGPLTAQSLAQSIVGATGEEGGAELGRERQPMVELDAVEIRQAFHPIVLVLLHHPDFLLDPLDTAVRAGAGGIFPIGERSYRRVQQCRFISIHTTCFIGDDCVDADWCWLYLNRWRY